MYRSELIRRLILSVISDDFENVDQMILPTMVKHCRNLGFCIERSDVVTALASLVVSGLAKAYNLSPRPNLNPFDGELSIMPLLDQVETNFQTYFYITRKGIDLLASDTAWWPFDDCGELPSDWDLNEYKSSFLS